MPSGLGTSLLAPTRRNTPEYSNSVNLHSRGLDGASQAEAHSMRAAKARGHIALPLMLGGRNPIDLDVGARVPLDTCPSADASSLGALKPQVPLKITVRDTSAAARPVGVFLIPFNPRQHVLRLRVEVRPPPAPAQIAATVAVVGKAPMAIGALRANVDHDHVEHIAEAAADALAVVSLLIRWPLTKARAGVAATHHLHRKACTLSGGKVTSAGC